MAPARAGTVSVRGVKKATLEPGQGQPPGEGDQVLFHFSVQRYEGPMLFSTRKEQGGSGCPRRAVLGHSRMIVGLEHALRSMLPGEAAMIRIEPEAHFGSKKCSLALPPALASIEGEELLVELKLLRVVRGVRVLSRGSKKKGKASLDSETEEEALEEEDEADDEECRGEGDSAALVVELDHKLLTKEVLSEGKGWEQPRPPFEVEIGAEAEAEGAGVPYFSAGMGSTGEHSLHVALGQKQLPTSLEKGIQSMLCGERSTIFGWDVAANAAVGTTKVPGPPSAGPVQYTVDLKRIVQVRDVLGNGKVLKKRIVDGEGEFPMDCPLEDCVVRIHYKGTLPEEGNTVFADTRRNNDGLPLEVGLGEGMLPEALETSVRVMLPGETALVTSASAHAYDSFVPRPPNVPLGEQVQWEVELISFHKPQRWDGLSFGEIMSEVQRIKDLGNALFKRELFQLARAKYEKMVRELRNVHPQNETEKDEWAAVTVSLQLNVAACWHRETEYKLAIEWADKVLVGNPNHAKALFRRGQALMHSGDFAEAREDFQRMMASDPTTVADGNSMLAKAKRMEEEANQKQRQQFKGLFDKRPGLISSGPDLNEGSSNATAVDIGSGGTTPEAPPAPSDGPLLHGLGTPGQGVRSRKGSWTSWLPPLLFYALVFLLLFSIVREFKLNTEEEL